MRAMSVLVSIVIWAASRSEEVGDATGFVQLEAVADATRLRQDNSVNAFVDSNGAIDIAIGDSKLEDVDDEDSDGIELPTTPTLAGCPRNGGTLHPVQDLPIEGAMAAVRCCYRNSNTKIKMNSYGFNGGNCQAKKTYGEALGLCKGVGDGVTLCTQKQLEDNLLCGTGCGFDKKRVWSLAAVEPTTTKPVTDTTTKKTTQTTTAATTRTTTTTTTLKQSNSNGPGVAWVGINGGGEKYTDSRGKLWNRGLDKWTPAGWGGWVGDVEPSDYTNNWGFQCRNWPTWYTQVDFDALLHHYQKGDSAKSQTLRVNLQSADEPVTYYTVSYQFCEKTHHGGKKMDILINGKLMKEDYTTKPHHTHTDTYKWKCIPTKRGAIDVQVSGKNPDYQSRFSTLEFEKSLDGCGLCQHLDCNLGTCAVEEAYDKTASRASAGVANEMEGEVPTVSDAMCRCNVGISGEQCEQGDCAMVDCNEPFGGSCSNNQCTCKNGYKGDRCQTPPDTDELGCYARSEANALNGKLKVHTLCLPEKIAGSLFNNVYRGPMSMHTVADRTQSGVVYFSWTADRPYGKSLADGRVYISKLSFTHGSPPVLQGSAQFDGFARSGGIDITESGTLGTLCAKYVPSWADAFVGTGQSIGNAPMALAVCEVNAATMEVSGIPWRIGKQYQQTAAGAETGGWGNYPVKAWFSERSAGTGYLAYAPKSKQWTAWYGATIGHHTGYAMHTYARDAGPLSAETVGAYDLPLPADQIANRQENFNGDFADHSRRGTGDHQAGAAWHYHSGLGDIGLMKHTHGTVYMQQYGLEKPEGNFAPAGHSTGRVELAFGDDKALLEGGLRQCGNDWILALITENGGNVCAKMSKAGDIQKWATIEASVGKMPCSPRGGNCGDGRAGGLTRIASLGSQEASACGSSARFLFGYEKEDRSRWLVEVDGECQPKESTRKDVTEHTTWPVNQDWVTTADGAVVWVTSWATDGAGQFGPKGSPNSVAAYPSATEDAGAEYPFGLTPDASNQAKVTIYHP